MGFGIQHGSMSLARCLESERMPTSDQLGSRFCPKLSKSAKSSSILNLYECTSKFRAMFIIKILNKKNKNKKKQYWTILNPKTHILQILEIHQLFKDN